MSYSNTITEYDLERVLNEVLPIAETSYSRKRLWTNPSPSASFTAQDVTNTDIASAYNTYDFIEVEYKATATQDNDTGMKYVDKTPCHAQTVASMVMWTTQWELFHRARWWNTAHTAMHFDSCYINVLGASTTGNYDTNMIPYKIYGIKVNNTVERSADYIVEQGTSGGWTYRKWNSGVAECWKDVTFASATFSASSNSFYRNISGITLPTGLFIQVPMVVATVHMGNVGSCEVNNITTTTFQATILSTVATARDGGIQAHAIGKWK